jgi:hypothetical protein
MVRNNLARKLYVVLIIALLSFPVITFHSPFYYYILGQDILRLILLIVIRFNSHLHAINRTMDMFI